METTDKQIGKNVTRIRNDEGLTQKEVADRMRALGWKWSQATVWMVETGERPLRLAESEDLADIFMVGPNLFTRRDPDFEAVRIAYQAQEALERLIEAGETFERLQMLSRKAAAQTSPTDDYRGLFYEVAHTKVSIVAGDASVLRLHGPHSHQ